MLRGGCFVLLGLALIAGIWTAEERQAFHARLADDVAAAAHTLASPHALEARRCPHPDLADDARSVIAALSLAEHRASGVLKPVLEWLILMAATITGLEPPDLSYGPMQIRLSRFRQLGGRDAWSLLGECDAQAAAASLIQSEFGDRFSKSARITYRDILQIAGWYNGQSGKPHRPLEGVVSDTLYSALVYELFQEDRFFRQAANAVAVRQ
jgi:hypothetical protein